MKYPIYRLLSACLGLSLLLAGCPQSNVAPPAKPVERPLAGVKLRLAIADDPALAAAALRARGEWNAQTGAEFEVIETTAKELAKADRLPADAVIVPSAMLGSLADRGLLAPVPKSMLHSTEWADLLPLVKLREATWGDQTMAVPFGSPVFCCYYRPGLLEKLGRRPPQTWDEYQELAKLLAEKCAPADKTQAKLWRGTIEPLAPGWAGLVLLARAAPYAKHRDNYSALFDIETMAPLIDGPPFEQALTELVAAAKTGAADPLKYDPAAVRAAFWAGQAGMALCWPSAAKQGKGDSEEKMGIAADGVRVGFVELPGSRRGFNLGTQVWDRRSDDENPHVPLLSIAGRLGVVAKGSSQVDAAFQLLLWLSDSQTGPQVCAASPATTLFRQSNVTSPQAWVEKPMSATDAAKYGETTEATLRHEQWLGALRLPGREEYLAALDEAVAAAVRGEKSPKDALAKAADRWREITKRLGPQNQQKAYRHSLGLE